MMTAKSTASGLTRRLGIPPSLAWGYLGVLFFMTGDGVESNYLAPYIADAGFGEQRAAIMITAYGVTVAVGSILAGAMSAWCGPYFTMMVGGITWAVFEVCFLTFGLLSGNYIVVIASYTLRGIAYPLFAYAFLVWLTRATPIHERGAATGWFWAAYTAGLPILGSLIASGSILVIGGYATFWLSLVLVVLGTCFALFGIKDRGGREPFAEDGASLFALTFRSVSTLWRFPKIGMGAAVRVISTAPQIGSFVFLPFFFTETIGLSISEYLVTVTLLYTAAMLFCTVTGKMGDVLGWRNMTIYGGSLASAAGFLILYYGSIAAGPNLWLCALSCVVLAFGLAGFVPLTVLIPAMKGGEDDGTGIGVYCFSAGLAAFVGPALVSVLRPFMDVEGMIWCFAALYVFAAVLSYFLRSPLDPGEVRTAARRTPAETPVQPISI